MLKDAWSVPPPARTMNLSPSSTDAPARSPAPAAATRWQRIEIDIGRIGIEDVSDVRLPEQRNPRATAVYTGQVERDDCGALWAVLYQGERVVTREHVESVSHGRRRVT